MANYDVNEAEVTLNLYPEELKPVTYNNADFEIKSYTGTFPADGVDHGWVDIDVPFSDVLMYDVAVKNSSGLMVKQGNKNPNGTEFYTALTNGGIYIFNTDNAGMLHGESVLVTLIVKVK